MSNGAFNIHNIRQEYTVLVDKIAGQGGSDSPLLIIPITFNFIPYKQAGTDRYLEFDLLSCKADLRLTERNFKCSEMIKLLSYKIYLPNSYQIYLHFPLTAESLKRIENYRKGSLPVTLDIQLQIANYDTFKVGTNDKSGSSITFIKGTELSFSTNSFEIEQSQWVDKILPQLGYKTSKLIEIPLRSELIPVEYAASLAELEESRNYFLRGDYDKVVAHCRTAIEPFKSKLPDLKKFITSESEFEWEKAVLISTSEWLEKMLKATSGFTSKPHHLPSMGHFDRSGAEIILTLTIGIIAYIGRLGYRPEL